MLFTTRYLSKYCFSALDVGPIGITDVRHCFSISCINPLGWDGFQRIRTNSSLRHARQTKWNENQRAPFLGSPFCSCVSNATKALVSVSHSYAPAFAIGPCSCREKKIANGLFYDWGSFLSRPLVYAILIAFYCLHLFLFLVVVLCAFYEFFFYYQFPGNTFTVL